MSKIGIVTVTYNGVTVLEDFVRCLKEQTCQDYILYVIDNFSSDDSANEIERLCMEHNIPFQLVRNDTNVGVARANNQGIRLALADACDPVIIANNDIEFYPDTLSAVKDYAQQRPTDMILPKVVFHDQPDLVWCAGGKISTLRGVPRTAGYRKQDGAEFAAPKYVTSAPTCFLVVPAKVFKVVGLMDEDYFVYLDDSDFVVRAAKSGYRIYYTPGPVIRHKVSISTGGADSPFTIHQISKNTLLFLYKNNPPMLAAWYIFVALIRNMLHLRRYDAVQRKKLFQGLGDGMRFIFNKSTARHNIPRV